MVGEWRRWLISGSTHLGFGEVRGEGWVSMGCVGDMEGAASTG